ncbi:hypothetical protein [Limibacterium fermenti]|uniref:hypothetical protein n=1 Tax=Limibacterium fermenti TaxID=3229863 RepID=UPI003A65BE40
MKNLIQFVCATILLVQLFSCSQENEMIDSESLKTSEDSIEEMVDVKTTGQDSIVLLSVNPDSIKSKLFKGRTTRSATPMAADYDPYFSSNMYAIDGLPFTLKARDGNKYLSASGKWQEVTWSTTANSTDQKFYVKVLPATSGIPYLIYSYKSKTSVSVGQYTANPNEKILLTGKDDSGDLYNASWDFIPSTSYPGYYAIESQSYIGQGSSGSWGDIFYHVVEVKDKNKVRYGQYTNKAQQEFAIKPDATFTLKNVEFVNEYNAKVTRRTNDSIKVSYTNSESRAIGVDLIFDDIRNVNSNFIEKKSIAFKVGSSSILFRRPTVTNDKIDFVQDLSKEPDTYYRSSQKVNNHLYAKVPVRIEPKTKLYGTYYFKVFDVEADYVATIEYNGKEAKISGRWNGRIHVDEIFETNIEIVDLTTNLSRGTKRVNVKNVSKSSPVIL